MKFKWMLFGLIITFLIQCKQKYDIHEGRLKYLRSNYTKSGNLIDSDTLNIVFNRDIICLLFHIPPNESISDTLIEFLGYNAKLNRAIIKLSVDSSFREYDYRYYSDSLLSVSEISDTTISKISYKGILLKYQKKSIKVYRGVESDIYMPFLKFKNSLYIDVVLFSKSMPQLFVVETEEDISNFNLIKSDYHELKVDLNKLF
ncbi:MAG: hypothetical protein Q8R57_06805 [Bacteroidota bacterium]|nr:hypothetical protein [Bacteroidota bacterium]